MTHEPGTDRMTIMRDWLERVCTELDVDPAVLDSTTTPLLALIRDVAHGPSRPGAPLTAFLVGLAAGSRAGGEVTDDLVAAVLERVGAVEALLAPDA